MSDIFDPEYTTVREAEDATRRLAAAKQKLAGIDSIELAIDGVIPGGRLTFPVVRDMVIIAPDGFTFNRMQVNGEDHYALCAPLKCWLERVTDERARFDLRVIGSEPYLPNPKP